jgi:hypothetical protein
MLAREAAAPSRLAGALKANLLADPRSSSRIGPIDNTSPIAAHLELSCKLGDGWSTEDCRGICGLAPAPKAGDALALVGVCFRVSVA